MFDNLISLYISCTPHYSHNIHLKHTRYNLHYLYIFYSSRYQYKNGNYLNSNNTDHSCKLCTEMQCLNMYCSRVILHCTIHKSIDIVHRSYWHNLYSLMYYILCNWAYSSRQHMPLEINNYLQDMMYMFRQLNQYSLHNYYHFYSMTYTVLLYKIVYLIASILECIQGRSKCCMLYIGLHKLSYHILLIMIGEQKQNDYIIEMFSTTLHKNLIFKMQELLQLVFCKVFYLAFWMKIYQQKIILTIIKQVLQIFLYAALFLLYFFIISMNKLMNSHLKNYRKSLAEQNKQSNTILKPEQIAMLPKISIPYEKQKPINSQSHPSAYSIKCRTNLRQLFEFVRQQFIIVNQKGRLITNHSRINRFNSEQSTDSQQIALNLSCQGVQKKRNTGNRIAISLPKISKQVSLKSHTHVSDEQSHEALLAIRNRPDQLQRSRSRVKKTILAKNESNSISQKRKSIFNNYLDGVKGAPLINSAIKSVCQKSIGQRRIKTDAKEFVHEYAFKIQQSEKYRSSTPINITLDTPIRNSLHKISLSPSQ